MDTGTKISGIAHIALIGAALFGGAFRSEPLPIETQDVAVVTAQEFEALLAAQEAPQTAPEPSAPAAPDQTETPPDIATPDPEPEVNQATPPAIAQPEPEPEPETLPQPLPPRPEPETAAITPPLPQPQVDPSPLPPSSVPRPRPRPVERVAPQPVAAPPPDTRADDTPRPDTAPDPEAQTPRPEEDATAPEEATDRVDPDTDADAVLAPTASLRPPAARPRPRSAQQDAVEAALREAQAEPEQAETTGRAAETPAPVPSGPPLTSGERSDLIVAVGKCWNPGALSTEAFGTTVVVGVQMTEAATPVTSSIRLLSYSGGSAQAAEQAFQAARRAILRCGASGFNLPPEKYDHWRDIEMTFNPEQMGNR